METHHSLEPDFVRTLCGTPAGAAPHPAEQRWTLPLWTRLALIVAVALGVPSAGDAQRVRAPAVHGEVEALPAAPPESVLPTGGRDRGTAALHGAAIGGAVGGLLALTQRTLRDNALATAALGGAAGAVTGALLPLPEGYTRNRGRGMLRGMAVGGITGGLGAAAVNAALSPSDDDFYRRVAFAFGAAVGGAAGGVTGGLLGAANADSTSPVLRLHVAPFLQDAGGMKASVSLLR